MHALSDTIVALATGQESTALGVIRMSGPQSFEIIQNIFDGWKKKVKRSLLYGHIFDRENIIDEVVIAVFPGPHSYTRQDTLEINCHGSTYILKEVIQLCLKHGAVLADPGEFTYRAFVNGRMDLAQSEAVTDLIAAQSRAQHDIALKQLKGNVSQDISELRQKFIDFASLIELELDFGEEDVEFADRSDLIEQVNQAMFHLKKLVDSFQYGNAIKNGIPVAIIGAPNAGKSTLLNALLSEERAIVSEIPGTTRDIIEDTITLQGITYRFIDTAGIRETDDVIEAEGVDRARQSIKRAQLVLFVNDVEISNKETIAQRLEEIKYDCPNVIVVLNKMDRHPYAKAEDYTDHDRVLPISAQNKMNIPALIELIITSTTDGKVEKNQTIISNIRHKEAFARALEDLGRVKEGLSGHLPGDLIAMDIRQAMHHIGTITGEISADDLLGNIFSRFCIGK